MKADEIKKVSVQTRRKAEHEQSEIRAISGQPQNETRTKADLNRMNTTALAFIGDAVYEVYVRRYVMSEGQMHVNKLHRMAVGFVKADAQAKVIKKIFDELSQEEQRLVKRARNHKSASRPKNADPVDYKWATAFEALVGYLYLSGETARMEEITKKAIEILSGD